jgi:hypothetical protein
MPVIINDFEVVTAAPTQQDQHLKEPQAAPSGPPPPPRPEDLERIQRRFVQRRVRLWAN